MAKHRLLVQLVIHTFPQFNHQLAAAAPHREQRAVKPPNKTAPRAFRNNLYEYHSAKCAEPMYVLERPTQSSQSRTRSSPPVCYYKLVSSTILSVFQLTEKCDTVPCPRLYSGSARRLCRSVSASEFVGELDGHARPAIFKLHFKLLAVEMKFVPRCVKLGITKHRACDAD